MKVVLRKWGNSLGVRIPRKLADDLGMYPGTRVRVTGEKGCILITPAVPTYRLARLLRGITAENLHCEIDTGRSRVAEEW